MGADNRDALPAEDGGLPPNEIGTRPPKPRDEKNSDQGRIQASYDAQSKERGTRRGNQVGNHRDDFDGLEDPSLGKPQKKDEGEGGTPAGPGGDRRLLGVLGVGCWARFPNT